MKITEKMQADRAFIAAAVSCDLIEVIKEKHEDWLDNGGYQPYYDLVVELTDHMLFSKGSMYLKYLKEKETRDVDFSTIADDCFDWFHMRLARELVTEELLHEICFGDAKEYFKRQMAKPKKVPQVQQVIPPAQIQIIQRALNLLESALSDIPQDQKDATSDISHDLFDITTLRGLLKGEVSVIHSKDVAESFSSFCGVDWPDFGDDYPRVDL
jgi:hypothetical protein